MILSVKRLMGYTVEASDGEVGKVSDIYFDDQRWAVRYAIVDTGGWLTGRRVLISPISIAAVDRDEEKIRVSLTREQVEHAPEIDLARPISRQQEIDYYNYYGWPYYWTGAGLWGSGMAPSSLVGSAYVPPVRSEPDFRPGTESDVASGAAREGDPNLRSAREVTGYSIEARDGGAGHLADLLVHDETWAVQHMVIDTTSWWPGGEVIIAPSFVVNIDWIAGRANVDLTRETIKNSPGLDSAELQT